MMDEDWSVGDFIAYMIVVLIVRLIVALIFKV